MPDRIDAFNFSPTQNPEDSIASPDKERHMRSYTSTVALLTLALCLAACNGNYKFSDDDYRPLGDPHVENRGN